MKKVLTILLIGILGFNTLNAQESTEKKLDKFRFGLKVTPGVSWVASDKTGQERNGISYTFGYGLQGDYKLSKNISITSGLLMNTYRGGVKYTNDTTWFRYDTQNNGITNTDTAIIRSRSYTWNSVDIPIKLKLMTPEIGYITYFAEFGATFNFVYKNSARKNVVLGANDTEVELIDDLASINNGPDSRWVRGAMDIGVGIEYNFTGSTSLLIGANWSNAFFNSLNNTSETLFFKNWKPFEQSVKSDYVALSIGVLF